MKQPWFEMRSRLRVCLSAAPKRGHQSCSARLSLDGRGSMVLVEDEVDVLRALNVCVRAEMGWSCAGEAARGLDGGLADALPGSSARRALGACDLGRDWQVSLIASNQTLK